MKTAREYEERNLTMALRLNLITWFQFFELWRSL